MSYYSNISDPYDYVKYTPLLFNRWFDWAQGYKPSENEISIRSFGDKIGPDWMKGEFLDIKSFFDHYSDIV